MIVGQETDGWYGELKRTKKSVDSLMKGYYDYFYQISDDGIRRGKRPFWNRKNYKYFEEALTKFYQGKKVSFVWNNISKIGNIKRGKPKIEIKNLERTYFNILKDEIFILNPDIIVFTTGSSRDSYIRHHFGKGVEFIPKLSLKDDKFLDATVNILAEVKLPSFDDIVSVRIEHPNRRTLQNNITLNVIQDIIVSKT